MSATQRHVPARGSAVGDEVIRALLWRGTAGFELAELPVPKLSAGQMLVRIRASTICGSDRHTVSGRRDAPFPSVLGHEGAGTVVQVETGTDDPSDAGGEAELPHAIDGRPVRAGDYITWSVVSACRVCDRCLDGHTGKCRRLRKIGHECAEGSWALSGTYATHIVLPRGHHVAHVPRELPDDRAAVAACAGATVMAALDPKVCGEVHGARVLIVGAGLLGILAVVAARDAGAAHVHVIDPAVSRRELALLAGADASSTPHSTVSFEADLALELSGVSSGVEAALGHLDIGGTAVLVGSVTPGQEVTVNPEALVRGRHRVSGVHNYEPEHLLRALDLLTGARAQALPWDRIISVPFTLEQAAAAFDEQTPHLRTLLQP